MKPFTFLGKVILLLYLFAFLGAVQNQMIGMVEFMEKIIEAKFVKNTKAFIIGIIGLLSLILGFAILCSEYIQTLNNHWVQWKPKFSWFFIDSMFFPFFNKWGTNGGIFVYLGIILIIVFIFLFFMMRSCLLAIHPTRVTGKASFGKQVDLPLNQISAISLSPFKGLTVATSAGRIHFWLIENRDAVYNSLNELLSNAQSNSTKNDASISSADELRKYKVLLDDGIITQEEFDAKKKQLLGL